MRIGILFSNHLAEQPLHDQRLFQAARERGHQCDALHESSFTILADQEGVRILYEGQPYALYDVLVYRPNFQEEPSLHQYVLDALVGIGQPILNGNLSTLSLKNKIWQHQRLMEAKVPMPRWAVAKSPKAALCAAEQLSFPLMLKVAFGMRGRGVFFVESYQAFMPIVDYLAIRDKNPVIMEEYIAAAEQKDIRAFVVNGRVIASMQRSARLHDVRANASLGGVGTSVTLQEEEMVLAIRAAEIFALDVAGVDLIRSERGPLVLEVNAQPGYKELEACSGVDVAGAIIEAALKKVSSSTS